MRILSVQTQHFSDHLRDFSVQEWHSSVHQRDNSLQMRLLFGIPYWFDASLQLKAIIFKLFVGSLLRNHAWYGMTSLAACKVNYEH